MHVPEFLDAFAFGPDVEIIESFLPDVLRSVVEEAGLCRVAFLFSRGQDAARKAKFQGLHHRRRSFLLWFADQQVDMLGHDHVTDNDKLMAPSDLLEDRQK